MRHHQPDCDGRWIPAEARQRLIWRCIECGAEVDSGPETDRLVSRENGDKRIAKIMMDQACRPRDPPTPSRGESIDLGAMIDEPDEYA